MRPGIIGDRYRVAHRLGTGGMARVYLCWDERLSMWVAIKVMESRMVADPVQRARFMQEARTLARLGHPHLIRLYDVAEDVECPYMVMEYAEGGSVASRLTRGALDPALAATLVADVCSALHAAHGIGVVHRDVKPQNLLLDADGVIKVADLGVAQVQAEFRLTLSNMALGTLAYMSPEQQRDSSTVDHRADIYSAGATLWAMVTARRPTPLMTGERVRALEVLGPALHDIVNRATAPRRDNRYASAAELESDLRHAAHVMEPPSMAQPLVDRPSPPPAEPPDGPPEDFDPDELSGTDRPFQPGELVPPLLRAAISIDDFALEPPPEPPRRSRSRMRLLLGVASVMFLCAGGCSGIGLLSGVGTWWYGLV